MQIYKSCLDVPSPFLHPECNLVLALGNFDGFHLGHQKLLERMQEIKRASQDASQTQLALLTFEPHPREFLQGQTPSPHPWTRIWGPWDLRHHLQNQNVDLLIEQTFDLQFSQTSAQTFLEKYIFSLRPQALVVGYDFAFGHHREGNLELLQKFGAENKIAIHVVAAVDVHGERISTTQIKKWLSTPDLEQAHSFLGRQPTLGGCVLQGAQLGRTIGVPTANVEVQIFPALAHGVYGVKIHHINAKTWHHGVANLGLNPTVSATKAVKLETHIFDFSGDLYDQDVNIEFNKYIRPEKKFSNFNELKEQIQKDLLLAKKLT